jgi:cytochrome c oxidase subunit 2
MSFYVVVQEQDDFATWLDEQSRPARPPTTRLGEQGEALFLANGCGACHAIRGTLADGVVGPDLTHVGSRLSIAAGRLANEPEDVARWIAHTGELKPSVLMPAFGMLPADEIRALAVYLEQLE